MQIQPRFLEFSVKIIIQRQKRREQREKVYDCVRGNDVTKPFLHTKCSCLTETLRVVPQDCYLLFRDIAANQDGTGRRSWYGWGDLSSWVPWAIPCYELLQVLGWVSYIKRNALMPPWLLDTQIQAYSITCCGFTISARMLYHTPWLNLWLEPVLQTKIGSS